MVPSKSARPHTHMAGRAEPGQAMHPHGWLGITSCLSLSGIPSQGLQGANPHIGMPVGGSLAGYSWLQPPVWEHPRGNPRLGIPGCRCPYKDPRLEPRVGIAG